MTNTQQIMVLIWSISFIIELISFYISIKKCNALLKKPEYKGILEMLKYIGNENPYGIKFKKILLNPYMYFIYLTIGVIISPLFIPLTFTSIFKKVFNIKSKLDKKIDEQNKILEKQSISSIIEEEHIIPYINDIQKKEIIFDQQETDIQKENIVINPLENKELKQQGFTS